MAVLAHTKTLFVDCFRFREVLYLMLGRDLKLKYKRTLLGYLWSLMNPVLQLSILSIVFSHVVRMGSTKNYSLYLFSGLLCWNFFSAGLLACANAFIENESFIKQIYLPKLIFPLNRLGMASVDFLFSVIALSLIGLVLGYPVSSTALLLPVTFLLMFFFTLGLGLTFAVLTVYFRDMQYLLGIGLQLLYYATPILYPIEVLPQTLQKLVQLNPVYIVIRVFQQILYFGTVPSPLEWGLAIFVSAGTFLMGVLILSNRDEDLVFRF